MLNMILDILLLFLNDNAISDTVLRKEVIDFLKAELTCFRKEEIL